MATPQATVRVTPLISKLSDYKPKQQPDHKPWSRYIYEDLGVISPASQVAEDQIAYLNLCALFITHIGNQFLRSMNKNMTNAKSQNRNETNIGYPIHSGTYHVLIEDGDGKYVAVIDRYALQKKHFVDAEGNTVNINPRNVVKSTDLVIGPLNNRDIFKNAKQLSLAEFIAEQVGDRAAVFIVFNNKPVMRNKKQMFDKQGRGIYDKLYYINLRWGAGRDDYGYYTPAADYNKSGFITERKPNKATKPIKQVKQVKQKQQSDEKNPDENSFAALEPEPEEDGDHDSEVIMPADAALVSSSMAKAIADQQQQPSYASVTASP